MGVSEEKSLATGNSRKRIICNYNHWKQRDGTVVASIEGLVESAGRRGRDRDV